MGRVTAIGGFFFRSKDPKALAAWYLEHFGIPDGSAGNPWDTEAGQTVFAPFKADTSYFRADKAFMLNLRVEDLDALIARLTAAGIKVKKLDDEQYGKFAHLEDPEGTPIELWEPPAQG